MEEEGRFHLIKVDENTELNLKFPDIMDLDDLNSIVEKVGRLTESAPPKKEAKRKPKGVIDMEGACREYQSAPWGQKAKVAEKYGINAKTLKWNVGKYRGVAAKPNKEKAPVIKSDLWDDYHKAPFGQKEGVAKKYGITLDTLRTKIHQIRKRMDISKRINRKDVISPASRPSWIRHSEESVRKMIKLLRKGPVSDETAHSYGFKSAKNAYDIVFNRTGKRISDLRA